MIAPAVKPPDCLCSDCLINRGERHPDVRAWLARRAPQADRITPPGWHYPNAEAFVLAHGEPCGRGRFTVDECRYVLECVKRAGFQPVMGQCWRNARTALVLGDCDRRLSYVEGYTGDHGNHHGWLTLAGKVVDITLNAGAFGLKAVTQRAQRWLGELEPRSWGHEYFGVTFPRELVEASNWREPFALADYGPEYPIGTLREPWNGGSDGR